MKNFKTFETWENNDIDGSLFTSGRAKYSPTVTGNKIKYDSGDTNPHYYAEITKKGEKLICKIYKERKKGKNKRLRNKVKTDLRLAHNYVREFLNQRIKKDEEKGGSGEKSKKKKNKKRDRDFERPMRKEPEIIMPPMDDFGMTSSPKAKSRTIIRKY